METILDFFGMSKLKATKRRDDDRIDRLNRNVTVTMLIFFAVVVTTKTFVGEPISCWVPVQYTGSQEDYVNSYCWIRNTYKLEHEEDVPQKKEQLNEITYYQWVPMILLVQGLFFYLPYIFWRSCSAKSGLDLNSVVAAGESFNATETAEVRDKTISYMTSQMDRYLAESKKTFFSRKTISFKTLFTCCTFLRGKYLFCFYMLIKLIFLVNVVFQFVFINIVFGEDFSTYGVGVVKSSLDVYNQTNWSKRFPRTTMCSYKVRMLGSVFDWTAQCVLPINHFNEKIFLLLWFWFIVVMVATIISLIIWFFRMNPHSKLVSYISGHIQFALAAENEEPEEGDKSNERKQIKQFVDYLDQDGVFVVRMLALNADTITATDFVYALYKNFKNKKLIGPQERKGVVRRAQREIVEEEEEEEEVGLDQVDSKWSLKRILKRRFGKK